MNTPQIVLVICAVLTIAIAIFLLVDYLLVLQRNLSTLRALVNANLNRQVTTTLPKQKQTKPTETTETMNPKTANELDNLIAQTKGKFFSITFTKADGTVRVANGKDKYYRLLKGGESTSNGNVPFVDRNKERWISARAGSVITFKCGKLVKELDA